MKKKVWNQIKLFALAGAMSLTLLGCGGTGGAEVEPPVQEEQQEGDQENPDSNKQTDSADAQNAQAPVGKITELGEGQFTIKEFYQETAEDGSEVLTAPAEGAEGNEDLKFAALTVLCDENTRIYKRTIRDGGASYEDTESSFEELQKGMEVSLKGSYEGDAYRASEVQIVDVIL